MRTRPSNIAATRPAGPHPKVNFSRLIPTSPFFSVHPRPGVAHDALPFDRIRLHQRGESRRGEIKRIDVVGLELPLCIGVVANAAGIAVEGLEYGLEGV